ncbi:aminopeptidase [Ideonella sp. A 288]|uniref:aminopeptidase n=1 Tax=Ideonella sp. A 288 TaxID=1962181 RepID=UPI000B4AE91C|nr:aminopeptidase [Ideonella sp. A 288]
MTWRRVAATGGAVLTAMLASGCDSMGYYAQSVGGHLDLMRRARPVAELLDDAATSEALKQRLQLAQRLRRFAVTDLALPDNASYHRYADLGRPSAVWNVVAAPELSLTLQTWCFPVMGCVGYRGYFDRGGAERMGTELRGRGLEVSVYGVPAYSTLGWSNWVGGDPLLNTFIAWYEADLARLIFHELAHQVAYAADDTTFNESFATAVERLGSARWFEAAGRPVDTDAASRRRVEFKALTLRTRSALEALYRSDLPDADKRQRKAELMATMRAEHAALKAGPWAGFTGYDAWFAGANNAALAVQAAYDALVPEFERLYERQGRDFTRFYAEVKRLAALPKDQRRATLAANP